MKNKGKKFTLGAVISWLLGFACALALGAVFYGAMAYQLTGEKAKVSVKANQEETPIPLAPALTSSELYPGPLLALSDAQLTGESAQDLSFGGQICRVIERIYLLPSGIQAKALSACPAAYLERMVQEGYIPQLITGFSLAGMDAVYAIRGEEALLCARDGAYIYMIEAAADEQMIYALGTGAYLE